MKLIIDRFEGNIAVAEIEDGTTLNIPKAILDEECAEGDIYEIVFLKKETFKRRRKIQKLKDHLMENSL